MAESNAMEIVVDENVASDAVVEEALDEYQVAFDKVVEEYDSGVLLSSAAIESFNSILKSSDRSDDIASKIKELCLYRLARLYTETKDFDAVLSLMQNNNDFFAVIPKAKTAKIVRSILEIVAKVPDSIGIQVRLCRDVVNWCKAEKRTFLRQRIESKLAHLLLLQNEPQNALSLVNTLLSELKKLDDKQMLTEAHLTESRIHHALRNVPKAKAALTAARTSAHAIYVTPNLQAELDEMSGILHCEENDYTTAYSYFLEAHDGYDQSNDARALKTLQYMILCKVLHGTSNEVPSLLSSKIGLKHSGVALEAMDAIAKAATNKSLEKFKVAVEKYSEYFKSDHLISHNLDKLYDKMLESNLLKIIHPYSRVEIVYVAQRINMPIDQVERKLSQMILDHRFAGILDQGRGELIVYDNMKEDLNYARGVETITNMGLVVDALFKRAKNLSKVTV